MADGWRETLAPAVQIIAIAAALFAFVNFVFIQPLRIEQRVEDTQSHMFCIDIYRRLKIVEEKAGVPTGDTEMCDALKQ